jgi:signal transduction histidine kinase
LTNAVEASTQERQRIAADLHDGVVQDLAGVAFGLAPLAEDADRRGAESEASALRNAIARLRLGIRGLRTLLVEIHPPNIESTGLEAALSDLLSPLDAEGVATQLQVDDRRPPGSALDPLVYRVANEAIRNVRSHAEATVVRVSLTRPAPETIQLVVEDDGRGFEQADRERRAAGGHVGLALMDNLVRQAGGELRVESEPGRGTTVELRVPAQ